MSPDNTNQQETTESSRNIENRADIAQSDEKFESMDDDEWLDTEFEDDAENGEESVPLTQEWIDEVRARLGIQDLFSPDYLKICGIPVTRIAFYLTQGVIRPMLEEMFLLGKKTSLPSDRSLYKAVSPYGEIEGCNFSFLSDDDTKAINIAATNRLYSALEWITAGKVGDEDLRLVEKKRRGKRDFTSRIYGFQSYLNCILSRAGREENISIFHDFARVTEFVFFEKKVPKREFRVMLPEALVKLWNDVIASDFIVDALTDEPDHEILVEGNPNDGYAINHFSTKLLGTLSSAHLLRTNIEAYHGGISLSSATGDYSDCYFIFTDGRKIPFNKAIRLNPAKIKVILDGFHKELLQFLIHIGIAPELFGKKFSQNPRVSIPYYWLEPEILPKP